MTTLFISFRGEASLSSEDGVQPIEAMKSIKPIENILAFPDGAQAFAILQAPPSPIELLEVRGFLFRGRNLYVANGNKNQHQILRFKPASQQGQWQYESTAADKTLEHPFAVIAAFHDALFVSSQDDNQITVYGKPYSDGAVFKKGFNALRGLAYDGTYLYVADSLGDKGGSGYVAIYDINAKEQHRVTVQQPVHLLYDTARGWLFIGNEEPGTVEIYNHAEGIGPITLIPNAGGIIKRTSGLALEMSDTDNGTLYVGSRVGRIVLAFSLDFSSGAPRVTGKPVVASPKLNDEPEFVGLQDGVFG
jgi:hypothetical protein